MKSEVEKNEQHFPEDSHAPQPQTINYKQETDNMEVHKHPHHVTHKKKWGEYLLEFLMLFLAVFLGFLAEYQLEHVIEHQREKKYMGSMVEDLKSDTVMLAKNITQRQERLTMIDSLVEMLNTGEREKKGNDIYLFARSISPPANIFPNDGTIQQLKSAGNLRLIRNNNIANSIMAYDQKTRNVLFEMGDEIEIRAEYRQLARKLFRTTVFHEMIATDTVARPTNNPQLYTDDASLINEYMGQLQYFKRVHQAQLIKSKDLLMQAKQLITDIKKEYHLE
ncbi:MAG TPA: hypothetical protein VI461_15295 [Chitinophagaceae bacterium]|nr:hypothetical protein [Chitinophagaceae bacterium]